MMIGPEGYYEEKLKGKSAAQIMTAIRSLKREISRLKNVIEHPEYQCMMHPSDETQLWCFRLYLASLLSAFLSASNCLSATSSSFSSVITVSPFSSVGISVTGNISICI